MLVAAEGERSGKSTVENAVDFLIAAFKDVEQYSREDFIEGTEPYEYLYLYKDDPFMLERKRLKIDAVAKKCGIRNFSKMFKEYCRNKGDAVLGLNVTDFPDQPLTLRCGNYICDPAGVKLDMEVVCPHPIMPIQRLVNIDTGIEKIKIAYSRGRGWRTAIFDRKTICTANKITELADIGVSITSETAKSLVKYFAKLEELNFDIIQETECVSRLGWINDGDELRFSPYVDNIVFDGDAKCHDCFNALKIHGNFEAWTKFITKNVRKNHIIARVVFAASLASVLIKPLGCLPFFIHLWGESGTGKSVVTMCAASIWGDPTIGAFIQTMNATFVGMERAAAFCNNLPFMMDELQIIADRKDFDKDIYMLTEGAGRTRGNKTGGLDITPTWRNCIITTGEKPILTARSGGGAVNRVVEVECKVKFFDDARAKANFVRENYGFFGRMFVAQLIKDGFDHADKLFTDYYNELVNCYDITEKQASSAALILTADKLAEEMLFADTPSLTAKEISDFLKTKTAVSVNPRAYEYVCEYVAANQNKFMGSAEYGEVWGVMDGDSVYILKNKFNQICDEGGYNAQSLLSWLGDRKLIRRTDGKNYSVLKRVGTAVVRCVHLTINNETDEDFSDIDL